MIKKDLSRFQIFNFYYRYLKFGILYIVFFSFLTGFLESIGISLVFPVLESILSKSSDSSNININVPFVSNLLNFLNAGDSIKSLVLILVVLFLLKAIFKFFTGYIKLIYSSKFLLIIRKELIQHFSRVNYLNYLKRDTGKLSSTLTLEVENMVSGFIYFANYLVSIFTGISFLFLILFFDFRFVLNVLVFGALYYFGFRKINVSIKNISKKITNHNALFNGLFIQYVQSYKYLKSTNTFSKITPFLFNTIHLIREYKIKKDIRTNFVSSIQEPLVLVLVVILVYISVVFLNMKTTTVLMLLVLFYKSSTYFMSSQSTWNNFLSQNGSTLSVIDLEKNLKEEKEDTKFDKNSKFEFNNEIQFRNISFKFTETNVIEDLTLTIKKNQTVALVGSSGSGKSTLVNILTGLLKPSKGNFTIDGRDIADINVLNWRDKIGYITQEPVIFNDTIKNNITLWNEDASKEDILNEIIEKCQLNDFIYNKSDLEKIVGDRGVSLSGGQKQRIAIARELYRKPELLILDEATSALDSEIESKIMQNLNNLKGKLTVVIIAHRLSTIKEVDCIYVLEKGKLIEEGSYSELVNNNESRLNKFIKLQEL